MVEIHCITDLCGVVLLPVNVEVELLDVVMARLDLEDGKEIERKKQ